MECNKDEALRAKVLAEKKMESNDFEGARKIAQKAQNLFPELENISQLLSVCDVHCSAQKKLVGTEKDWYGILQVEKLADELTVKKQYRRLALYLHPDKNKLPGAESAFKLISEAHNVLSDPTKKSMYDSKLRYAHVNPLAHHINHSSHSTMQFRAPQGFTNGFRANAQQHPSQLNTTTRLEMFWTACPYCNLKYHSDRRLLHGKMHCERCSKSFTAYEISFSGVSPHMPPSVSAGAFQKPMPYSSVFMGSQNNVNSEAQGSVKVSRNTVNSLNGGKRTSKGRNVKNAIPKRAKKHLAESSESFESSSESDDIEMVDPAGDLNSGTSHAPRRSSRPRKNISYSEVDNDDDLTSGAEKFHESKLPSSAMGEQKNSPGSEDIRTTKPAGSFEEKNDEAKNDIKGDSVQDLSSGGDIKKGEFPDPEFNKFDDIKENRFDADQFWACYDEYDSMPRFYAKVTKVIISPFKLNIRWLEADPVEESQRKWVSANLPVGCGNFKLGRINKTSELSTFSHEVHFEEGRKRGSFTLYPREGEVWAVFRDWDFNWSSNPDNHEECKYDIVEILSDLSPDAGIRVHYLIKVRKFESIFQRSDQSPFLISTNEVYRFAHQIPSVKMLGTEREGVAVGSYELDPASLPANTDDLYYPAKLNSNGRTSKPEADLSVSNGERNANLRSEVVE